MDIIYSVIGEHIQPLPTEGRCVILDTDATGGKHDVKGFCPASKEVCKEL